MPNYMADAMSDIASRIREIRKEQGLPDEDWHTATGADLDAIGAYYDLTRTTYESDGGLRARVEAIINKRKAKW